jgi:ribosome biogenesis protein Tsr3
MNQLKNGNLILRYIIISRDEKIEKKCTLYPFRGREDFSFRIRNDPGDISSDSILLTPEGESLTFTLAENIKNRISNNDLEIVLVDSRWKKAKGVVDSLPDIQKVSLKGYETGARRRDPPPKGGLASCEALYLASLFLGQPDHTLLDKYHFKNRFFRLNNLDNHKL